MNAAKNDMCALATETTTSLVHIYGRLYQRTAFLYRSLLFFKKNIPLVRTFVSRPKLWKTVLDWSAWPRRILIDSRNKMHKQPRIYATAFSNKYGNCFGFINLLSFFMIAIVFVVDVSVGLLVGNFYYDYKFTGLSWVWRACTVVKLISLGRCACFYVDGSDRCLDMPRA